MSLFDKNFKENKTLRELLEFSKDNPKETYRYTNKNMSIPCICPITKTKSQTSSVYVKDGKVCKFVHMNPNYDFVHNKISLNNICITKNYDTIGTVLRWL